jgi:hypothetical protein
MTTTFDAQLSYNQTSPGFRAGDGFVTQSGMRFGSGWIGDKYILRNRPNWLSWLVEIDGSLEGLRGWDYDGTEKMTYIRPGIDLAIVGQTTVHFKYKRSSERFAGTFFPDLYSFNVFGSSKFMDGIGVGWNIRTGHAIYYDFAGPAMGKELNVVLSASIKPIGALTLSPNVTFSRLDSLHGKGSFYNGAIYWTKLSYQFSREMDLRLIAQYNGFGNDVIIDPLLTYKVNPFTCFYLGSNHGFYAPDGINTLAATDRQFYAKIQYLFQA